MYAKNSHNQCATDIIFMSNTFIYLWDPKSCNKSDFKPDKFAKMAF